MGFLTQTFMIHRTAVEGGGFYLTFLYHLHPLHRHLDISQAITAESPSLFMASSRIQAGTFA